MVLTGQEIRDLAHFAGFVINSNAFGEDDLEAEYTIIEGEAGKGIALMNEEDDSVSLYKKAVYCDVCDHNEASPLGDAI